MAKVMIVEDDKDIRRNVQRLLRLEGYEVVTAENGRTALDFLDSVSILPDLIILDLMMPVMNGFEFRQAQKSSPRYAGIPVMIMTADENIEEKKQNLNAFAALRKPMDIHTILETVKKVC